jgi:cytochrome c5
MSEEHENFIKTPKQLIIVVAVAFIVPTVGILLLATLMTSDRRYRVGESPVVVAERVKPIGELAIAGPKVLLTGDKVYDSLCKTCHEAGLAGAPKLGDSATWGKLIAQGQATTVSHAITGIRAMPPKGGNPDLTDEEVAGAVVFMANKAGANWKAPELKMPVAAPAQAATGAATAPAAAAAAIALPPMPAMAAAAPKAAAAPGAHGKAVYDTVCTACHTPGIAGAPKMGDKAAWAVRLKQGMDTLHASAIKGKGAMPPKGGNTAVPDADVIAAVDYLVAQSK